MPKSIHREEYDVLIAMVRQMRLDAGLKQSELSEAIGRPQSFISNLECGIVRVDVIQLKDICEVCGKAFSSFCREFEKKVA